MINQQDAPGNNRVVPEIVVLGFGNILMGDDALGPYVIRLLESMYEFAEGVSLLDIGTPGLGVQQYLAGVGSAIIVDTIRAAGAAGEVRIYDLQQLLKYAPGPRMSPHDPGLKEALLSLQFGELAPRSVLLVGVIPLEVNTGIGLSTVVRYAIPKVQAEVIAELSRLGKPPRKRVTPLPADIWWDTAHLEDPHLCSRNIL